MCHCHEKDDPDKLPHLPTTQLVRARTKKRKRTLQGVGPGSPCLPQYTQRTFTNHYQSLMVFQILDCATSEWCIVCWELLKKEKQFDSKILLKNHIKGLFGLVGIGRGLNPLQVKIALISSNPLGRGLTEQALKSALHYEMHFYAYPCKICCFI